MDKFKVVISDCHLSAGRFFEGQLNPHEDFHFDDEMCALFEHFSTGTYGDRAQGPVEVELFINGDFLDFLNVPYHGEFEDGVTEEIALYKLDAILKAHVKVMAALRRFASQPGKTITYLIGNHDADLFFEKVRERITREWDPEGHYPSDKVKVIADVDRVIYEGGLEIHHGNQQEAVHVLDFKQPFLTHFLPQPILNLPWSSLFVLKIINRLKWERDFIDKVRPIKVFLLFGLVTDTWFTLKFCFLVAYFFLKTRFTYSPRRKSSLRQTIEMLRQERSFLLDLEREARVLLDQNESTQTIIFGHTHRPMDKIYPDGKQYINTGTWTKMINLDWRSIGKDYALTFALVRLRPGQRAEAELRHWIGEHSPHQVLRG